MSLCNGPVAQLGERTVRIRKVMGSIPTGSTTGKLPHPIRPRLHKSKVFTTGREFGCCAICSTPKHQSFDWCFYFCVFPQIRLFLAEYIGRKRKGELIMSGIGETVFYIILGAAVLLKAIDVVWDIVIAIKRKRRGKIGRIFARLLRSSDHDVVNRIQDEQNRIFTENSIRAHEQAMFDHQSAVHMYNDSFNNMF